jgi:hypothetical protein
MHVEDWSEHVSKIDNKESLGIYSSIALELVSLNFGQKTGCVKSILVGFLSPCHFFRAL